MRSRPFERVELAIADGIRGFGDLMPVRIEGVLVLGITALPRTRKEELSAGQKDNSHGSFW